MSMATFIGRFSFFLMLMGALVSTHTLPLATAAAPLKLSSSSRHLEAQALLQSGWWCGSKVNRTSNHCRWPGITCNRVGSVIEIESPPRGCTLGSSLEKLNFSYLPNLIRVNFYENGFTGRIPPQIGVLSKLKYLDLSFHYFEYNLSGPIPSTLGNLTSLEHLDLSYNHISGPIPSTFGNLCFLYF